MVYLNNAGDKTGNNNTVEYERLERLWDGGKSEAKVMARLLIVGRENEMMAGLSNGLRESGFGCSLAGDFSGLEDRLADYRPDLVIVGVGSLAVGTGTGEMMDRVRQAGQVPVVALVTRDELDSFDIRLGVDDFIANPADIREMALRIRRLLRQESDDGGELMEHEGLVIDPGRCEVTVDGEVVDLTFREYELLKFLAGHKGRVHSREMLLNQVWGYDYFGGDRTVDVHIRRLRSKIETRSKYIETVRNIGYRFRSK